MSTLGPGSAVMFTKPSPACTVEHSPHRNSLARVLRIVPGHDSNEHDVCCRAVDGYIGWARVDELKPLDEWGDGAWVPEQLKQTVPA